MTDEKIRENRARRVAERRGMTLKKTRRRDPQAIDFGGFMLIDTRANAAVFGVDPFAYSASLEDVEDFLGIRSR